MIHFRQLIQLLLAHTRELVREPGVLFWGIVFPILMSLGLGLAFTQKVDMERDIAWIPSGKSSALDRRIEAMEPHEREHQSRKLSVPDEKLGNTVFIFRPADWDSAMIMLKRGSVSLVVLEKEQGIEYHFDPRNSDAQLTYLRLHEVLAPRDTDSLLQLQNQGVQPLTLTGTRYIDFLVPGLIAMGVMMSCMWGLTYGIIDKRSKKLLRRMVATPMRKSHFLASLITVRMSMNILEAALLLLFAWLAFGITIQGDPLALLSLYIAGNIAFAGIAVLLSARTSNTEVGNGFINAVVMPMMVLSGIFFSYHNFPDWSIGFIQLLPLTMLADSIRSVFIEGAGFAETWKPLLVLSAIGFLFLGAGLKIFKWH